MPHQKTSPLLRSARRSDLAKLRQLLAAGNDPDQQDDDGNTPLTLACEQGHREIAALLLQHGASPDYAASAWKAPLAIAAFQGNSELCELLLAHGADIDRETAGKTPLANAIWNEHPALAAQLIALGADVDLPDDQESAPVVLAARGGFPELLAGILKHSRKLPADPLFTHAMSEAAAAGQRENVALLLDHGCRPDFATPPTPHYIGFPLREAARVGDTAIVSLLLASGARVDERSDAGNALTAAAEHGHDAVVAMLLARQADVQQRDCQRRDALAWALVKERPDIAGQLLRAGAQPGPQQLDATFLLIARSGDVELARRLLDAGANPQVQLGKNGIPHQLGASFEEGFSRLLGTLDDDEDDSDEGSTALLLAAEAGQAAMVDFLLESGLAVDARNRRGDSALLNACFNASSDAAQRLLAAGADPRASNRSGWHCMHSAARSGNPEMVGLLAAHGADVNCQDDDGWSPLIEALRENQPATARRLLALGAIARPCRDNYTPLMAAARGECLEMLDELLARGEDVNARWEENGRDALMLVAANGQTCSARRLIELGADVQARDSEGKSALDLARDAGHGEVVALLAAAGADPGEDARPALDAAYYWRLIEQLQRCLPQLDASALPAPPEPGRDVFDWLQAALAAQDLIAYREWKEYWGDLPELAAFDDIDLAGYSPQPLLDLLETHGYPDWPSEIPYFEYQNHHLQPHGLRLLSFAYENIHLICVRDDADDIEQLEHLLAAAGIPLIVHGALDLGQCRQFLQQFRNDS